MIGVARAAPEKVQRDIPAEKNKKGDREGRTARRKGETQRWRGAKMNERPATRGETRGIPFPVMRAHHRARQQASLGVGLRNTRPSKPQVKSRSKT